MKISSAQRRRLSAALLLLGSTFLISGCSDSNAHKVSKEELQQPRGVVVYAIKDVPEGNTIELDALEEREMEVSKIPQDALMSAGVIAGRIAKYGISSGQIINQHDIAPRIGGNSVSLRFRDSDYARIEQQAVQRNMSPDDIVRMWIEDKLDE